MCTVGRGERTQPPHQEPCSHSDNHTSQLHHPERKIERERERERKRERVREAERQKDRESSGKRKLKQRDL